MAYGNSNRIDLNSQWVSVSEDSNYTYFKSNSNVGIDDSFSQCKVTWSNLTSVTFKYMSSSEMDFDYLCVGKLDGEKFTALPSDGDSNVYLSTKGKESGTYYEFTIDCNEGEHHIWFCYRKDSSNNNGEDRGFIGVPKSAIKVLDIKQGSELPTEYKSYGVSAEGGKIYDINYNNVTVPNGNIVTVYEDFQKVEKTITYEYVDLGLPSGALWAKYNIGATSETDYGVYFQWGETNGISGSLVGKYSNENYSWATYKYCNGSYNTLTKYNTSSDYGEKPDNKTSLDPEDDPARVYMGGDWRMPIKAEIQELIDYTTNEWFTNYDGTGVNGWKFTSKTDTSKYIFIPAAGYYEDGSVVNVGDGGDVWSSSLYTSNPDTAWGLYFDSGNYYVDYYERCLGHSVRGVQREYEYEVVPDEYIYNETDHKYYQKLVAYGNSNRIDLNSQWVSVSEDSNYTYFKSNSNVGVGNSYSQCKVTWSNLTSITFKYMSSSEMNFDYLCVGKLDGNKFAAQPSDGDNNVYLSTKGKTSGTYYEFTINCDEGEHHIWFCYRKDGGNNNGEDRGFIGVPKSVVSVLDVKQGAELPMEYKSGGVSAEGGKTYNISFNSVTLPNGSIIVPSYEDYTKTEKTINTEYVDLGLPSHLKWATCNIGASSETESGAYFQWGETNGISGSLVGKYSNENYSWATYKYCNGSETTLTKYNTSSDYGEKPDNKTSLDPEDDPARVYMGGDWRMPTEPEAQELVDNTDSEWVTINGIKGRKFTSRIDTSKYIFIPAAGSCGNGSVQNVGYYGKVWNSSLGTSMPNYAYTLFFDMNIINSDDYNYYGFRDRCLGLPVRGVHA